jgi:hypothetical protein
MHSRLTISTKLDSSESVLIGVVICGYKQRDLLHFYNMNRDSGIPMDISDFKAGQNY